MGGNKKKKNNVIGCSNGDSFYSQGEVQLIDIYNSQQILVIQLTRFMPTHQSSLPLLTVLLFLSASIVVVSSQTLSSPDELLKDAYNKTIKAASLIAIIPSLLDRTEPTNPLKPCTNCGSCLLSLSRLINAAPDTSTLSIQQIKHQIEESTFELVARQRSEEESDDEYECQNLRRQIEIQQLQKSLVDRIVAEQYNTINKLDRQIKDALYNLSYCNTALKSCQDNVCPTCPIPQPCPISQPCPPRTTCEACQQENRQLKYQLQVSQSELRSANVTINGYKNSSNSWNKLIGQAVRRVTVESTQKLAAKNASNVNVSGIIRVLQGIEKSTSSQNTGGKTQQQLVSDLSGEFLAFVDKQATAEAEAKQNNEKYLKKFGEVLSNLKECNEQLKKKYNIKK